MQPLLRVLSVVCLTTAVLAAALALPAAGEPLDDVPATVATELPGLPAVARGARTSEPVTTPMPFSMVGFEVPAGAEIEFRTSADGETWTQWVEAHVNPDEGPDPTSDEARDSDAHMSAPVWVGEAAHLQTRLVGGGGTARPEHTTVHLIDSSGLGRSLGRRVLDRMKAAWRGSAPEAEAATKKPTIIRRSEWGANESWRRGSPSYASKIVAGFVHHTVGPNKYTKAQSDDLVRGIYRYHTQSNGWSDIGYNFLVDRYGRVYEGRYGGMTKAVIGAHAGGFNTATFGVSLMGTFTSATPTSAMRNALIRLLAWKYDVHHTSVLGKVSYTSYGSTKYAAGRTVDIPRLSGHRHVSSTSCPGSVVFDDLRSLRSAVRNSQDAQGGVLLYPNASPSKVDVVNGRSISGAVNFSVRLRPAAPWTLVVRNPSGSSVFTASSGGAAVTSASPSWTPTKAVRGTYRFVFSSGTRRKARGAVLLTQPTISAWASPTKVTLGADKSLSRAVTLSARLYNGATWSLRLTDPSGKLVHSAAGVSSTVSSTWDGPGTRLGRYRWVLSADDVTPRSGSVRVFADRVTRRGYQRSAITAAANISRATFPKGSASRAVLTRADLPGFALPAGSVAGRAGPVLYSNAGGVPAATIKELKRTLGTRPTLYVMGGPTVISRAAVRNAVAQISPGRSVRVVRVGGRNAIAVSAKAADVVLRRTSKKHALLVGIDGRGGWRQGIAAAAAGARLGRPVLLTRKKRLALPVRRALSRNGVTHVMVVSNASAVPKSILRQRPSGSRVARIGGGNPAAIAAGVSRRLFRRRSAGPDDNFVFANVGRKDGWARSLVAAPYAARRNAPVLVTAKTAVPLPTRRHLNRLGYTPSRMGSARALGNRGHVSVATEDALSRHLQ